MDQHFIRPRLVKLLIDWGSVVLLAGIVLTSLVLLGWLIFFTDTFIVRAVTVVDARAHTTAQIRQHLDPVVGANIFFIQADVLEQQLKADIPQVRDVHIVRKLPGTLKVTAQEKTPVMLLLSSTNYYFVDAEGIAYEEARLDTLPGVVLPTVKNQDTASSVTIGQPVVAPDFISFIAAIHSQLEEVTGAKIVDVRIPSLAAREVHFHLDNNWEIRFDVTRSAASQLSVLRRLLADTIPDQERPLLEYIDLRIPNRAYYRTTGSAP